MNPFQDPIENKELFRQMILKLIERKELESLVKEYVRVILGHRIHHESSIGPYGEHGKDFVAIENIETKEYCSYIVKQGNLKENLKGQYGILNQMEEAMNINIEDFKTAKRTARVVYNGNDGYRGSVQLFNDKKFELQQKTGELLLREIERWDIEVITETIFPHAANLREIENMKMNINRVKEKEKIFDNFINKVNVNDFEGNISSLIDNLIKDHKNIENNFGLRSINNELD